MKASLVEIMESIQGEGLLVGSRNIFLRFAGCNLRCAYCDTPASLETDLACHFIPRCGGGGGRREVPNPLSVDQVQELLAGYSSRWISLTGGEPLLWVDFINDLGKRLKPSGCRFLLETNGILYDELSRCLEYIDLISMDYKLPSATGEDHHLDHQEFLKRAASRPVYVKIVIDSRVEPGEIQNAVAAVADINPAIPLILQPVTPKGSIESPLMEELLEIQRQCLATLEDVRILPQLHRYLGLA